MKRPFAVIGFTMLLLSVILCRFSIKTTVVVFLTSAVVFLFLFLFRKHYKDRAVLFALMGVVVLSFSFLCSQYKIFKTYNNYAGKVNTVEGTVIETKKVTDYKRTYILKLKNINGKRENIKIKFISNDNLNLEEGNIVNGSLEFIEHGDIASFVESNLSNKILFTVLNNGNSHLEYTNRNDLFYKFRGTLRNYYSNMVKKYLPNEYGGFANAIIIGDRGGIEQSTFDTFNYAGTSHILVISGLHLSVWAFGLVEILQRSKKLKKYANAFGILGILFYSALTGFSVSIIRAGIMAGTILIGEMFKREADSINSLGIALAVILTFNPYAIFSIGFWFSFLSTLGILIVSKSFREIIYRYNNKFTEKMLSNSFARFVVETLSVTVSTTLFTLPVFVLKTKIIPIFAVFSNLLIVNISFIVMILAVVGMAFHIVHFYSVANGIFAIVGVLSKFIFKFANAIGMCKWSTISANHKLYKYLILLLLLILIIGIILKMRDIDITKHLITLSLVLTVLTMTYCTIYEYNTPSLSCVRTKRGIATVIATEGKSIVLGDISTKEIPALQNILKIHNVKSIDALVMESSKNRMPSQFLNVYNSYNVNQNNLIYDDLSCGVTLNDTVHIKYFNELKGIAIECNGTKILILNDGLNKNVFQNIGNYDIIIHSSAKTDKYDDTDIYTVQNVSLDREDKYTIYFNREKIKWVK